MSCQINYDFALSAQISAELKDIAEELKSNTFSLTSDYLTLFSKACNIESSKTFFKKFNLLSDNFKKIYNDVMAQAEEIEKVSRHMLLIEKSAVDIVEDE